MYESSIEPLTPHHNMLFLAREYYSNGRIIAFTMHLASNDIIPMYSFIGFSHERVCLL